MRKLKEKLEVKNTKDLPVIKPFVSNMEYLEEYKQLLEILVLKYGLSKKLKLGVSPNEKKDSDKSAENGATESPAMMQDRIFKAAEDYKSAEKRFKERLELSDKALLKLEQLSGIYELDESEKTIIALIFFAETVPMFTRYLCERDEKGRYIGNDSLNIGDIISLISKDFEGSFRARGYFSAKARLITSNVIEFEMRGDLENSSGINNIPVKMPFSIINYISGDTNEYSNLEAGLEAEDPETDIDNVIIEDTVKEKIMKFLRNYNKYVEAINEHGFSKSITYGKGTTFLFYGAPGTGKTLLGRAIAKYLGKSIITMNFKANTRQFLYSSRADGVFKRIFRKAKMMNAVLFIDECDELFVRENSDYREFLVQLEKFNGVVILATNRIYNLDQAMDRRIAIKVGLRVPDAPTREKIWAVHFPDKSILAPDVDFTKLSRNYIFAGGHIKNAVLNAVSKSVERKSGKNLMVTMADLSAACEEVRSQMVTPVFFSTPYYPKKVISSGYFKGDAVNEINGIVKAVQKTKEKKELPWVYIRSMEWKNAAITGEILAHGADLPVQVLPVDVLIKEKSEFYLAAPTSMLYSDFRRTLMREIIELSSVLVLYDQEGGCVRADSGALESIFDSIKQTGKTVVFISSERCPLHLKQNFNFILEHNDMGIAGAISAWDSIVSLGIKLDKTIKPAALAQKYKLTSDTVKQALVQVRHLYYFNGEKPLDMETVDLAVKNAQGKTPGMGLFEKNDK